MRLFKQYHSLPKNAEEFASRLRTERLATYLAKVLVWAEIAKRTKTDGVTSDTTWENTWHTCSGLAEQTDIDFAKLKNVISGGKARSWGNIGELCFNFLVSVYPCVPQKIKRDIYVCSHCEGIYSDEPVTRCDCTVGDANQSFVKGHCFYTLPER